MGRNRHTLKKNTKALVDGSKEVGLEANADKTKYMVMSRDQNAGRCHNIKIDNSPYERLEELKYLGTTITNQNSIQEEIKNRLKSGSACFHPVQKLLSSSLLSKNIKIKIYRTIILPVILYGCDTLSLTLTEERRLRVSENRVLRRMFGTTRNEVTGEWRRLHNEELNDLYFSTNFIRAIKSKRIRWAGHVVRTGEKRGAYRMLVGTCEGKRPLVRPRHRWEDNIKMGLQKM